MSIFADVLLDALIDCVKELPFLFAAFLFMEAVEHHASEKMNYALSHAGPFGPLVGAVLGCVPQCGFSIMASDFYSGGVITLGTLIAVFLSTSDEALAILLSDMGNPEAIGQLLVTKVIIAVFWGYLIMCVQHVLRKRGMHPEAIQKITGKKKEIHDLCEECGCEEEGHGILRSALRHTIEVLAFLFIFTFALNLLIEVVGMERVSEIMLQDSLIQPVLAALIGLIPNCAASVMLTQMYLDGVISFASAIAGLSTGAGLGLAVLFRMNKNRNENIAITVLLFVIAAVTGLFLQAILL